MYQNMNRKKSETSPKMSPKSSNFIEVLNYNLSCVAWKVENLRNLAVDQRLPRPRTLAWAIMLNTLPPVNDNIMNNVKSHRNHYSNLKKTFSTDPRVVVGDDPLSQKDESAWNQHFCDNELKALILQDVVRTYPDEVYFRDKEVQDLMVRVLFAWARAHSSVGYRQGMHEVLAPLLYELHADRQFAPTQMCETLAFYLKQDCLEHDSYMLFSAVMNGLKRFYTTGEVAPSPCGRLPVSTIVHNPNEVVRYLDKVREDHLLPIDFELASHLTSCNISLELFGIRWLRLLFGREFARADIPHLWGYLFADGDMFPNIHFVVVAMLVSMRQTLMDDDPGVVLSALMRPAHIPVDHVIKTSLHLKHPLLYPMPPPPKYENTGNHINSETWTSNTQYAEEDSWSGSEGVAEGADVSRALAALALLRSRLPRAATALAAALPKPPPDVAAPLAQILHLAALLECRNHELVDVETALEAAEGQNTEKVGRKQLVPISLVRQKKNTVPAKPQVRDIKEVPLKLFHHTECVRSDSELPKLDPLGLRTE